MAVGHSCEEDAGGGNHRMIDVLVIPERNMSGSLSPCAYLRLFLPLTKPIASRSVAVRFARVEDIDLYRADVVISHRVSLPKVADAVKVRRYCDRIGAKWIFDLDDDLLALSNDHPEQEIYAGFKPAILSAAAGADRMWVSTAELAQTYARFACEISIVRNTLDHRIWRAPAPSDDATAPIRFIYMGTSTHRQDFEKIVAPSFSKLAKEFGDKVHLDVVGVLDRVKAGDPWSLVAPPHASASAYPGFVTWMQLLRGHAVGLAPLRDTPFNSAKSNIKWLEYSALGLATIATDLPPYQDGTQPGEDIMLAGPTAEAFGDAMRSLVVDRDALMRLRRNAASVALDQLKRSAEQADPRIALIEELATRANVPQGSGASDDAINKGRRRRSLIAQSFLRGHGIEIGALHDPLAVPAGIRVRYVDRLDKAGLYEHYPELRPLDLVEVDVIDNGEMLNKIETGSQDFVIANHFIEHCGDPIRTLKTFARVLVEGGVVYMAIPDQRFTFDKDRARTPIAHLIEDHRRGPERSKLQHYREWVTLVEPHFGRCWEGEESIAARMKELLDQNYSIHFHVWQPEDFAAFVEHCIKHEDLPFEVLFAGEFNDNHEMIYILRRT
jgi:SAM-dependent methyltransferase